MNTRDMWKSNLHLFIHLFIHLYNYVYCTPTTYMVIGIGNTVERKRKTTLWLSQRKGRREIN